MNLNDVKKSNFLKKEDVGQGALATIAKVDQENVAKEGAPHEYKVCLYFTEFEKPMVLNSTNAQIVAKITGQEEDIEKTWIGARVVLYNDPNITFQGKLIGGIRIRAPRQSAILSPTAPAVVTPVQDAAGDGLPF
jgi:hypothetical protein